MLKGLRVMVNEFHLSLTAYKFMYSLSHSSEVRRCLKQRSVSRLLKKHHIMIINLTISPFKCENKA